MTKSKGVKVQPPGNSVPTYIRLTRAQIKWLNKAVRGGSYQTRSEAVRAAVTQMFGNMATTKQEDNK